MVATTVAAMAARRRRSTTRPKPVPLDMGTEQTRRRLEHPPWNMPGKDAHGKPLAWPRELQEAASEMDTAVRVRIEALRAKAQDIARGAAGHDAGDELPPHERHCYRRYIAWLRLMAASRMRQHVPGVIGTVVDGERLVDVAILRAALTLWATGRVRVLHG